MLQIFENATSRMKCEYQETSRIAFSARRSIRLVNFSTSWYTFQIALLQRCQQHTITKRMTTDRRMPMRMMARIMTAMKSRERPRPRSVLNLKPSVGSGIDSSICAIEPAPTTGRPRRNRRMNRCRRLGGPNGASGGELACPRILEL